MSEHEKTEEHVDDLDVPPSESDEVKGGLPAVQKVREAAGRMNSPASKGGHGGEIEVESFSWGSS
jgi:hypothetical protein